MHIISFKKFLFAIFLLITLFSPIVICANTQNTISSVTSTVNINSDGELSIIYRNIANSSKVQKVTVTTYIEKKHLGIFWQRIDIGTINNEWIDTIHDCLYIGSRSYLLPEPGVYRTTVSYKFYDSNSLISTITCQSEDSF